MSGGISRQRLTGGSRVGLIAGIVLLLFGVVGGSWLLATVGLALLIGAGVTWYSAHRSADALEQPWPFPPDYRTRAEALGATGVIEFGRHGVSATSRILQVDRNGVSVGSG